MNTFHIQATKRGERRKKVRSVREKGKIPAVLYGHGLENKHLSVDSIPFDKVYKTAGESSLIDLAIENETPVKVLVHDIQYHPLTEQYLHIDFYQVRMDEKISTSIELKFVKEAPAVKELGAILVKSLGELEVECLPQDLVHAIEIDISALRKINDQIRVKDIVIPVTLKVLSNPEEVIVSVAAPRSEEELAALETTITEDVASVEVVGEKEKKEKEAAEAAEKESKEGKKEVKKEEKK